LVQRNSTTIAQNARQQPLEGPGARVGVGDMVGGHPGPQKPGRRHPGAKVIF